MLYVEVIDYIVLELVLSFYRKTYIQINHSINYSILYSNRE